MKRKKKTHNIQLNMLIGLMKEAERDLFSEELEKMPIKIWLDKEYDLEDAWWDANK